MNFLKKSWRWTKENFSWVVISTNIIVIFFVISSTARSASIADEYESRSIQLIKNNTILVEQNKNLSRLLDKAGDLYKQQNDALQRQKMLIDMQRDGINKLLQRVKELERLLNDDFIAAS